MNRTLAVITARGASKGVPRKNLVRLAGRPLVEWVVRAAERARLLTRIILSTDDAEIADLGRRLEVEVPFLRPEDLARDETPTLPVLLHAVRFLEDRGERFDAVCLLQPSSPLVRAHAIDRCIELLFSGDRDAVVTIAPVPHQFNPHWVYFQEPDGALRLSTGEAEPLPQRQALPAAFRREGSVYVVRRDVLIDGNSLYGSRLHGFLVDPDETVNIDCPEDLARAERIVAGRGG